MEQALEQIRQQQKESWNTYSSGWNKWGEYIMEFLYPMGEAIIRDLHLKDTDIVLDIATGTGEPALSIAAIVKNGKVIGTDLADKMLDIAAEHAASKGIHNFETRLADVSALPFDDNTFDAISCRFGFMFFPDLALAAKEMARVLKPGGRIATVVWAAPAGNAWVTAAMSPTVEVMQIPPPPPEAPGLFRCAKPGMVEDLFASAGLKNIVAEDLSGLWDFRSKEALWNLQTEVAAPIATAMSKATEDQKNLIRSKVFENVERMNPAGGAKLSYATRVISAEK